MKSRINCCKDCEDREVGCHAVCEKYLSEKAEVEKENERRRKQIEQKAINEYLDRRFYKYRGQR